MNSDDESLILSKEYPPIFGLDKLGKTRVWKATVFSHYDSASPSQIQMNAMAVIQHGIYDGKLQTDTRKYTEGKNIGKKNETTPLEQCISEVEKKRKDKIEKEGYSAAFPSRDTGVVDGTVKRKIFPMLANKYEPAAKTRGGIVFPCYVQPKLDGLRCVVCLHEGAPTYQSRTGGYFTGLQHLDHAVTQVLLKTPTLVLDGELYTQQIPFEELAGIIKKKTLSEADKEKIKCVQYHVYDLIIPDMHFKDRLSILNRLLSTDSSALVTQVPTVLADTPQAYKDKFGEYVADGYEGIMLRNANGFYQENYRSNDLMKYKEFFEDEYKIVGFKEATGRDAGTVIWECETKEGMRFSVRPKGTQKARREWFANGGTNVGKQLTVIYQELSEMGVPRFPVGKAIRDGY
jgi:ATP-dependent DNA ligase